MCVCVIAEARCRPTCQLFNPGANVEVEESLSALRLLIPLMCGVHNRLLSAAPLLRRSTLMFKMLLRAIQHRESEKERKKKQRYTEDEFGC